MERNNGSIKVAVSSAFIGNLLQQIDLKIKMLDIKEKILCSYDFSSHEIPTNEYSFKYEEPFFDEYSLHTSGYSAPDDLDLMCCFEVVPKNAESLPSIEVIDDNEIVPDLDIICNDGGNLKVHKFVLAKQSVALKRSLEASKTEIEKNKKFKIAYSSDIVKEMIRYVYTGKVQRIIGKEMEMIQIATEVSKK